MTAIANNIGDLLTRRAALNPEREAVYDVARGLRLSFFELAERAHRLANALIDDGVKPGDRVGLLLMNSAEFIESFFAIARLGAVVVPLNWRLTAEELRFILQDSGTATLIFDDEFADTVDALVGFEDRTGLTRLLGVGAPAVPGTRDYTAFRDQGAPAAPPLGARDQDALYIMYTSGTTGLPKGVVHTHESALWGVLTISATADLRPGDRYLQALPLFHVGALTPGTLCVYLGVTSIVMRSFDPAAAWKLIEEERVTTGLLVPAMLNFMLQVPSFEGFDRSALRWMMSGAAPVPVSLIERYAELSIDILQDVDGEFGVAFDKRDGDGRRSGHHPAQGAAIEALEARHLEHEVEHGRNQKPRGHPLLLNELPGRSGVEAAHDNAGDTEINAERSRG